MFFYLILLYYDFIQNLSYEEKSYLAVSLAYNKATHSSIISPEGPGIAGPLAERPV